MSASSPSPSSQGSRAVFEHIALQMVSSLDLQVVLTTITQGLVHEIDAAFARIWFLGPADLCGHCYKSADCTNRVRCLHLVASAGMYTNLNGEYWRIPLGALKIGKIAQGWGALYTNDVLGDDRLPNKEWMRENRLCSFAGFPLIFRGELLGGLAMFGRRPLSDEEFGRMVVFAHEAAIAIKNAQLFEEVERLKNRLQAENLYLREELGLHHNFEQIIGDSPVMKTVFRKVEQVAPIDSTVLILGETGTGKELIARAIHNLSPRRARALVKVNCAAIPAELVESELFGHEKGSFSGAWSKRIGRFELAEGGTIFLDEIGELAAEAQVKLLRVLQEREFDRVGSQKPTKVDVRVIAATNRDLRQAVQAGSFRDDLLYRLDVSPIEVPPLRARPSDIPLLVRFYADKFGKKFGKKLEDVSQRTMERLTQYAWPGNVRELEHVIERAVILSQGSLLRIDESFLHMPVGGSTFTGTLVDVERAFLIQVLSDTDWVVEGDQEAAVRVGLHPNTLRSRMKKMGIKKPRRTS